VQRVDLPPRLLVNVPLRVKLLVHEVVPLVRDLDRPRRVRDVAGLHQHPEQQPALIARDEELREKLV